MADGGRDALRGLIPVLEATTDWTAHAMEAAVKAHAETAGLKLGKLAQPLRAALTGTTLAGHFRRAGGAWTRGIPRPPARPGPLIGAKLSGKQVAVNMRAATQ